MNNMEQCRADYMLVKLVLLICLIQLSNCSCETSDAVEVGMYQIDPGFRSVNSSTIVVSVLNETGYVDASFYISQDSNCDPMKFNENEQVASLIRDQYGNIDPHLNGNENYSHLTFSLVNSFTVLWNFTYLPASYDGLYLTTLMTMTMAGLQAISNQTQLHVRQCESPDIVKTTGQDSYINITAISTANYNDLASCSCPSDGEELYHPNGTKAKGEATCDLYAEWTGCKDLQCWSGPRAMRALQLSCYVKSVGPFNCSYTNGFPVKSDIEYRIDDLVIPTDYILKSTDNGKNLSCNVSSAFTKENPAQGYGSQPVTIIVYYPPENSTLSQDSLVIELNESKLLNYSFFTNPKNGSVELTIDDKTISSFAGLFSLEKNYTESVHHIYEFNISVTSKQQYGLYQICSSTENPSGKNCTILDLRNMTTTTVSQPTTATISVTTDSKENTKSEMLPLIIGGSIAGLVLVVLSIGLIVFCKRRKKRANEGEREVRLNELYGVVPNRGPPEVANAENVKQERDNVLYDASAIASKEYIENAMEKNPDEGAVGLNLPASQQPSPSNMPVYSQVDLSHRRIGNQNEGCNADSPGKTEETEQEQSQTSDVVDAVVDTTEKHEDQEPSGPVYAMVNKPRQSG